MDHFHPHNERPRLATRLLDSSGFTTLLVIGLFIAGLLYVSGRMGIGELEHNSQVLAEQLNLD